MKHFIEFALVLFSVSLVTGCERASIAPLPAQTASAQPQAKDDFYLSGFKRNAGPHGMDVFTFAHQGRSITATCEMDGGEGSCSGLISKVGQHLFGSDEIRNYKDNSIEPTANGQLVIFSGPGTPAPEICKGCLKMAKAEYTLWVQSVEVEGNAR